MVFQAFWADLGAFLVALDHILASKTGPKTRQNGDLIQGPFLEPKLLENGPQNGPRMAPKIAPRRYLGGFLGFRRPALSLLGPALLATWLSRGLLGAFMGSYKAFSGPLGGLRRSYWPLLGFLSDDFWGFTGHFRYSCWLLENSSHSWMTWGWGGGWVGVPKHNRTLDSSSSQSSHIQGD